MGDPEVGVTIMQMDQGMDTGDMLMKVAIAPDPDETAGTLFPKIAELGSQALMDTLDLLGQGGLAMINQEHDNATSAPMLTKEDGLINWQQSAETIHCLIRGLDPWPTAYCYLGSKKAQVFSPAVVHQNSSRKPGTLIRADREGLLVATRRNCLLIRDIKLEGKKRLPVSDFLNGYPVEIGINLSGNI